MNPDTMIDLRNYINSFASLAPFVRGKAPWSIVKNAEAIVTEHMRLLPSEYMIRDNIAIHKNARVEAHAIIKGPAIISDGCFIAANAYLRGGVFLADHVVVGPGTEIKSSFVMNNTTLAHFNFIGDSVIGSLVNMEAGSVIANHYNERNNKTISIFLEGQPVAIPSEKFGALVGDGCRIGANAVLSPGTILTPGSIVDRLQLVKQCG
jgi:UDP-N-acetylglucosamine diphosphorylase / glucose-1-phosphate thymidylyltransferase / UDP-N-acetylgalactosamine diphosphorylase / glucosamine-1-phosphate N-acetyltransferase / galactosamine-1-phosphate N-acetyltransferase